MPRAPHLQSIASAAPGVSTVTSYGWISARTPSNRIRRSRRTAEAAPPRAGAVRRPAPDEQLGQRLDDRAADLRADLLAPFGDLERRREDRLAALALGSVGRGAAARTASGTSPATTAGPVDIPFMTARARTRWAGAASASSAAARATSGSAWIPA